MSRSLVTGALLVFAVAALGPLVVMLLRIESADVSDIFQPRAMDLLRRTLWLGGCSATCAFLIGLPFGFLTARTDMPGAGWLRTLGIVPLLLPPLMLAMTWAVLIDFKAIGGPTAAIFVLTLSTYPLVALFSSRAFERIDGRLEEAARLAGGNLAVLRADLPLVLPAAIAGAALTFTFAINDFAVPDYVTAIKATVNVYAAEVKLNWDQFHRPGKAVASALPLIVLTGLVLWPALRLRRRGAMASLGSGFVQPARMQLGPWRWPAFLFCSTIVVLGAFVPLLRLLWEAGAMGRHTQELSFFAALAPGFETVQREFGTALELARADIGNSLLYATGAGLVAVPLGLVLGHAIERMRNPFLARGLELVAILPIASPAILFGIGCVVLWNTDTTADFYDSGWMAGLVFVGRYAAFPVLVASGAVASIGRELEEAGALAGVGPTRRLLTIVAPALKASLIASFVLVFVFAMRDLDAALMVPAANKTAMLRVFNGVHFGRDSYVASLCLLIVFAIVLPGLLWSVFARKRLELLP